MVAAPEGEEEEEAEAGEGAAAATQAQHIAHARLQRLVAAVGRAVGAAEAERAEEAEEVVQVGASIKVPEAIRTLLGRGDTIKRCREWGRVRDLSVSKDWDCQRAHIGLSIKMMVQWSANDSQCIQYNTVVTIWDAECGAGSIRSSARHCLMSYEAVREITSTRLQFVYEHLHRSK